VQDDGGKPVPGFIAAECLPVRGDSVRLNVGWRRQKNLTTLQGRTVRLRLQMRTGRLYSFQLAP